MAVLRRRTTNLLTTAWLACALVGLALGGLALWVRPETRLPAIGGWIALGALVHAASGDRVSLGSLLFGGGFTLPMLLAVLATYEVHVRWGVSMAWGLAVFVGVLALHGCIFLRALIASGSADYPYDDD